MADPSKTAELKTLGKDFLKGVVVVIAIGVAIGFVVREPAMVWGKTFVDAFGLPGVFGAFFILDSMWVPVPHEAFSGLALLGGLGFWQVVGTASIGSILGGWLGFWLSRTLGQSSWFRRRAEGPRGRRAKRVVEKFGLIGVVLGAISPLPYAPCAWVAGAFGFPSKLFLMVSILRVPRVAFYLWLIQLGFLYIDPML